jgi:hypothetical protein
MAADARLLEVFILTPDGPVTLHLHPSATIATIAPLVCKRKRWQHNQMAHHRFCSKSGAPMEEGATLAVLGLESSPCPTLLLLPMPTHKSDASFPGHSIQKLTTSAGADVEGTQGIAKDCAARCLQSHVRPMLARLDEERQEHAFRLRMVCARSETRAALFVQLIWRSYKARASKYEHGSEAQSETTRERSVSLRARALQVRAAATVKRIREEQEAAKARQRESETYATLEYARLEREAKSKRKREAEQEQREAEARASNALVMLQRWWRKRPKPPEPPPPAFILKQTAFRAFGRMQLVTWRLRHVEVTQDAVCYYRVRRRSQQSSSSISASFPGGERHTHERAGEAKLIPLETVRRVGVQRDDKRVLVLQCREREFFFRLPSRAECDEWATKISVMAAARAATKGGGAQADSTTSARTSGVFRDEAV